MGLQSVLASECPIEVGEETTLVEVVTLSCVREVCGWPGVVTLLPSEPCLTALVFPSVEQPFLRLA